MAPRKKTHTPRKTNPDAFQRREHAPDELRHTGITSALFDRIEALHLAHPARLNDTPGHQRMVTPQMWADAIVAWALPVWEAQAQDAVIAHMIEHRRPPRPAELAERINAHAAPAEASNGEAS